MRWPCTGCADVNTVRETVVTAPGTLLLTYVMFVTLFWYTLVMYV
jgi:hypothetical protein